MTKVRGGRVRIDIVSAASGAIHVTVARACDNPSVLKLVDEMLAVLRQEPQVLIKDVSLQAPLIATRSRRGGPVGMPEGKKLEIVRGWFNVQGQVKEAIYAQSRGISTSTLRRWIREFHKAGKL